MIDVIKWLESPEGEEWSCQFHKRTCDQHALMIVKPDFVGDDIWLWLA